MQREVSVSLNPLPSSGDTKFPPILTAWSQAGETLRNREFSLASLGTWEVSLDTSTVIDFLEAANELEVDGNSSRFDTYLHRWRQAGAPATMKFLFSSSDAGASSDQAISHITTIILQELFIALNLCAAGAGHLNGVRSANLPHAINGGYYGDSFETAWNQAEKWNWPHLTNLHFEEVWTWLGQIGFRDCVVAHEPVHMVLALLLETATNSSSEVLDVLLLSRALEALMSSSNEGIGRTLSSRISQILGEPAQHRKWFGDFYRLRSKIAHGDFPIIRPDMITEDESVKHASRLWTPVDRAKAVIIALLQALIRHESTGFHFEEKVSYISHQPQKHFTVLSATESEQFTSNCATKIMD